jgi:hypothetical protein
MIAYSSRQLGLHRMELGRRAAAHDHRDFESFVGRHRADRMRVGHGGRHAAREFDHV